MQDSFTVSTPKISETKWVTDGAWMTGVVGCIVIIAIAVICQQNAWLDKGVNVFGLFTAKENMEVQMFCLVAASSIMCIFEFFRLLMVRPGNFFNIAPEIKNGSYFNLILACVWRYSCYLIIFSAVMSFYKAAGEYGFARNAPYYQPWFMLSEWLYTAFIWLGLPYVFLTYTFKYDKNKEVNSYHRLIECVIVFIVNSLRFAKVEYPIDRLRIKKIILGLIVRIFFIPLMTVFFTQHFPHLVSNFGYMFDILPQRLASGNYSHAIFNQDLVNIFKPIIFSIDVVLAWCGYVLTSRWLDNETQSAEPTMLGWVVCLISYPPFQLAGLYFYIPSEGHISSLGNQYFVSFFSILMLISFIIYTSATVVFGVRFSNLTHRGIIRTGPFAIIRHPAYTSKNIGWWLGIFPVILYLFLEGKMSFLFFVAGTVGLMAQSGWYYLRAITEERHLSCDPAYLEYCEKVKYRFIPKVF